MDKSPGRKKLERTYYVSYTYMLVSKCNPNNSYCLFVHLHISRNTVKSQLSYCTTVRIKGTFIKDRFKHVYILSSFALIPIVINWVVLQWHAAHYNKSSTAFYIYDILLDKFTNMSWLRFTIAVNCGGKEIIEQ